MDIETKLIILDQIYRIYDNFVNHTEMACKKYCSECCTSNVTVTSVEGRKILDYIKSNGKQSVLDRLYEESGRKGFVPKITTNRLALICSKGDEPPVEDIDPFSGKCFFLQDDICPFYEARPFGCRCFSSLHNCLEKGYAQVDPFIVTINSVFLQYIEHIDSNGYFGNLVDIIRHIICNNNCNRNDNKKNEKEKKELEKRILKNHSANLFLIPEEHQKQIRPVIDALSSIKVPVSGTI